MSVKREEVSVMRHNLGPVTDTAERRRPREDFCSGNTWSVLSASPRIVDEFIVAGTVNILHRVQYPQYRTAPSFLAH